jgi:hypothetical protein
MRAENLRLRAQRPPKEPVDIHRPLAVVEEQERRPGGEVERSVTVFLAGRECPFTCIFCDLWRHTLDEPTPPGAIPEQLRRALEGDPGGGTLKLYNASNYFDSKAVPPEDDEAIARLASGFDRVVVECHPRLIGQRTYELAERLDGRLQVALGLETAHPEALSRLNKGSDLRHFRLAAARLADAGIEMRSFVLVGAPFIPRHERLTWVERSAALAFDHGAVHVSLVPLRGDSIEMQRLATTGDFVPPTLREVEEVFDRCLVLAWPMVVMVDSWDLDRLLDCPDCGPLRRERLEQLNRSGRQEPPVICHRCGGLPGVSGQGLQRLEQSDA